MSDDLFDTPDYKNAFVMISRDGCGYCDKALNLFNILGIPVDIKKIVSPADRMWFVNSGYTTFPRIFRNGELLGGYDDFVSQIAELVGNHE